MTSLFGRLKSALKKSRSLFKERLISIFKGSVDADRQEELEELFFEADLGSDLSLALAERLKNHLRKEPDEKAIEEEVSSFLQEALAPNKPLTEEKPAVIFVVGVNGTGKTTSIAKLAHHFKRNKKKVLLAAADTFRAAAPEQLEYWANKVGVDIVKGAADPAAVVFDAIESGLAKGSDLILVDTAGRLQTKKHLMQELGKMIRVASKKIETAPHEVWLVLDASLGQNSLSQAEAFAKTAPLTGLILTKLDGSAKGGSAVAISHKLGLPIKYIGIGEGLDDLEPFDPKSFVEALIS